MTGATGATLAVVGVPLRIFEMLSRLSADIFREFWSAEDHAIFINVRNF